MHRYPLLFAGIFASLLGAQALPSARSGVPLPVQAAARLAQHDGKLTVTGLESPVEILRDKWGIPHIYAKSTHDLFFAQGYVAAQDHMWQMELWRRNTRAAVRRDVVAGSLQQYGIFSTFGEGVLRDVDRGE